MLIDYMRVLKIDRSSTLDLQCDALLVVGIVPEQLDVDVASGHKDDRLSRPAV